MRAGDRAIIRDGHGTGKAHGDWVGEVHDRALKAAETDATKRALATFGKVFGLALYAGAGRLSDLIGKRPLPSAPHPNLPVGSTSPPPEGTPTPEFVPASSNGKARGHTAKGNDRALLIEDVESSTSQATGAVFSELTSVPKADSNSERAQLNGSAGRAIAAMTQPTHARVDKSALALSEPRRRRDKEHLRFVASQPCLLCSSQPCDAHHLRFSQPRALGRKVGDDFTVPLCRRHHRDLHESGNEAAWWHDMGIDAIEIAEELWTESVLARLKGAQLAR